MRFAVHGAVKGQVVKPMIEVTDHDYGNQPVGVETETWQMDVRNMSPIEGSTLTVTAKAGPLNTRYWCST